MATSNVVQMPLTANQPQVSAALHQPAQPVSAEALRALGSRLMGRFGQYESDRRIAEQKWIKNQRQFLGVYDPEIEAAIDKNRSRAYPKLTRVKCVSMLSRLMNLLFPVDDKNWAVCPSAVPDLDMADLQPILDALMPANGQAPDDAKIEAEIFKFAQKRADRLELEIVDQLQDLGGCRADSWVALCRKVLMSGIQYGAGVLRGPFVHEQKSRYWQVANGRLTASEKTVYRPRFEFVPLWDYYPDMSAKTLKSMDGQFLRPVLTKQQLIELKKRADFNATQIDLVLRQHPQGNYKRRNHETELRAMGSQQNVTIETGKYEAVVWDGNLSGSELREVGANIAEDKLQDSLMASVWMIDGIVIKAELNPWVTLLEEGEYMPMYHHFIFEEDESFILGNGLPNIMRDSQMGLNAAVRMAIDNGSVQRIFEVNYGLLRLDADVSSIDPDMVIPRDDDNPATANVQAVRPIELPMNIDKMMALSTMFQGFADTETFVSAATGGDMQKGPSEPFRTAAGASMLRGDAALPFKDVVRNFDVFTESVIGALITFNRHYNTNANVKGDFTPVARGATSLIAKEVQGMQIDNLATTLTDQEKKYLNGRYLLRKRLKVRDLEVDQIVYDDERCDQIDQAEANAQAEAAEQQRKVIEANIRKTLSDALKNIAQANKNAAGAEATIANLILAALEKGLNPDMLASSTTPTNGDDDGDEQPAGGTASGAGADGSGASEQRGAGLGGLESATGAAAAGAGSRAAAMPAG